MKGSILDLAKSEGKVGELDVLGLNRLHDGHPISTDKGTNSTCEVIYM